MSRALVYIRVATKSQISEAQEISREKNPLAERMFSEMKQLRQNRIDALLGEYQLRRGCKVE